MHSGPLRRKERSLPFSLVGCFPFRHPLAVFACLWLVPTVVLAQAPGGFVESDDTSAIRTPWTTSQMQGFLPLRGTFAFPAPYNTEGIRLTNATDCGGKDCVVPIASSHGRNINNHRGRDTVLVFLGLRGVGPTLFGFSKATVSAWRTSRPGGVG